MKYIFYITFILFSVAGYLQSQEEPHIIELKGHTDIIWSAAFSPDGKKIVTASSDGTARIWDAETGKELHKLEDHRFALIASIVSPDGKKLVIRGVNSTNTQLWDIESGGKIRETNLKISHLSPDRKNLALTDEDEMSIIWNIESGSETICEGNFLIFSPEGKRLLTIDKHRTIRIIDVDLGKMLNTLKGDVPYFSPDGKIIAVGSYEDDFTWIVDTDSGKVLHTLEGAGTFFFPDGKKIATGSDECQIIRVWDIKSGRELYKLEGRIRIREFFPDGKSFFATGEDDAIWHVDADSGKVLHTFAGDYDSFFSDGKKIWRRQTDGTRGAWDVESWEELYKLDYRMQIRGYSPDEKKIVIERFEDRSHTILDADTGTVLYTLEGGFISFFPDEKKILTSSDKDNVTRIVDADSGNVQYTLEGNTVFSFLDRKRIVTMCHKDGPYKVWDAESGKELYQLEGSGIRYFYLSFGKQFVMRGDDETRIWDIETGKTLYKLEGRLMASYSNRKQIVATDKKNVIRIWTLPAIEE